MAIQLRHGGAAVRSHDDVHLAAGLVAVFAWGIGPFFMRSISVSAVSVVWYRILVGVPLMGAIAVWNGTPPTWRLFKASFLPALFFGSSMALGFASLKATSIANATLITTIQPILVMAVAPRLFGEQLGLRKLVLAAISLGGVLMVVMAAASSSGASVRGDLYAVANVCLWTAYFLMAKRIRLEGVNTWAFLSSIFTWSFVIMTPWVLAVSDDVWQMQSRDWLYIMLMAIIPGVLGHGLMTWASRALEVTTASLIGLLAPVVSTVGAWPIFGQSLRPAQLVGGAVVVVSLAAFLRQPQRQVATEL